MIGVGRIGMGVKWFKMSPKILLTGGLTVALLLGIPAVIVYRVLYSSYLENREYRYTNEDLLATLNEYSIDQSGVICFFDKFSSQRVSQEDILGEYWTSELREIIEDMPKIREGYWGVLVYVSNKSVFLRNGDYMQRVGRCFV